MSVTMIPVAELRVGDRLADEDGTPTVWVTDKWLDVVPLDDRSQITDGWMLHLSSGGFLRLATTARVAVAYTAQEQEQMARSISDVARNSRRYETERED